MVGGIVQLAMLNRLLQLNKLKLNFDFMINSQNRRSIDMGVQAYTHTTHRQANVGEVILPANACV